MPVRLAMMRDMVVVCDEVATMDRFLSGSLSSEKVSNVSDHAIEKGWFIHNERAGM